MAEDWFYYNTRVCSTARSSLLQRFVSFDSGYKRVSPVTNAVVPTTIPFTSGLFSRCRCAMNRKPLATSLSKIIPSICRIYRSDIFPCNTFHRDLNASEIYRSSLFLRHFSFIRSIPMDSSRFSSSSSSFSYVI